MKVFPNKRKNILKKDQKAVNRDELKFLKTCEAMIN